MRPLILWCRVADVDNKCCDSSSSLYAAFADRRALRSVSPWCCCPTISSHVFGVTIGLPHSGLGNRFPVHFGKNPNRFHGIWGTSSEIRILSGRPGLEKMIGAHRFARTMSIVCFAICAFSVVEPRYHVFILDDVRMKVAGILLFRRVTPDGTLLILVYFVRLY